MSEQPKPLSAEVLALVEWIGNKTNLETHEGRAVYLHADDCPSFCDFACNGPEGAQAAERFDALLFATLDAERKRADAAERRANSYEHVLNEIAQEGCGCDEGIPYRCPSCRANDLDLTKEVMPHAGADHSETPELHAVTGDAHPNHAEMLEDWQECASHLVLAIKSQFHEESRTDEMREALAEFDRLASEATKGVEF